MANTKELPRLDPRKKNAVSDKKTSLPSVQEAFAYFFKRYCLFLLIPATAGYFFYCHQTERLLQKNIYLVLKEIGENGFGVSYSKPKGEFFAFTGGLYIDDLKLTAPEKLGGSTFKAARIAFSVNPLNPDKVTVRMRGGFSMTNKTGKEFRFQVENAEAQIFNETKKSTPFFKIVCENLISVSGLHNLKIGYAALDVARQKEKTDSQYAYDYTFSLNNVRLAADWRPLPEKLEFAYIKGVLRGLSARRRQPLLDDWLNNSGTLDVTKGEIVWHPLMSEFSATFGLTPTFSPMMAASAKVFGFFGFLDALEKKNVIRASDLSVAKIVLGQKLKVEDGDAQLSLTSPFSLQFGKFYAGQVLLYDAHDDEK